SSSGRGEKQQQKSGNHDGQQTQVRTSYSVLADKFRVSRGREYRIPIFSGNDRRLGQESRGTSTSNFNLYHEPAEADQGVLLNCLQLMKKTIHRDMKITTPSSYAVIML